MGEKLAVKWRTGRQLKPKEIFKRLNKYRKTEDGKVSFSSFEIDDAETAIYSMLDFNEEISCTIKSSLIREALFKITGELNESTCLNYINNAWKRKKRTKEENFFLLTTISISKTFPLVQISINGCKVSLLKGHFPKKYNSRNKIFDKYKWAKDISPNGYRNVIVSTKSRFIYDAVEKCLDALDLLRTFICFYANHAMQYSFGGGYKTLPINRVILGGVHTLHNSKGQLAISNEIFWYLPNFQEIEIYKEKDDSRNIYKKNLRLLVSKYERSNIKKDLKKSILNYIKGYDQIDYHQNLIMSWAAFELLLSNGTNNNDSISRRSSFLWDDYEYHKQIVEHLRHYRNIHVHTGEASDSAKTHCYQLQRYYKQLIYYYLLKASECKSLSEANSFLDLSKDIVELKQQKLMLEKAIKFRGN